MVLGSICGAETSPAANGPRVCARRSESGAFRIETRLRFLLKRRSITHDPWPGRRGDTHARMPLRMPGCGLTRTGSCGRCCRAEPRGTVNRTITQENDNNPGRWLLSLLPMLSWWPRVDRRSLRADARAGLIGTIILVPQSLRSFGWSRGPDRCAARWRIASPSGRARQSAAGCARAHTAALRTSWYGRPAGPGHLADRGDCDDGHGRGARRSEERKPSVQGFERDHDVVREWVPDASDEEGAGAISSSPPPSAPSQR